MYRYRLRMNANGQFIVQRKEGWFGCWVTAHFRVRFNPATILFDGWRSTFYSGLVPIVTLFDDSADAIKGLLEAQAHDEKQLKAHRWTTVIDSKKQRIK